MAYFDHAATTEPWPELVEKIRNDYETSWYNPASAHLAGQMLAKRRERALRSLAQDLDCEPHELTVVSGATEATNQMLFSVAERRHRQGHRILCSAGDHAATLAPMRWLAQARGFELVELPLTEEGTVDLGVLRQSLDDSCILLSTLHVNNETGAINDLEAIRIILAARAPDCLWHVDSAQAWTKTATRLAMHGMGADYVSLSGHKIHGPRSIGLLYTRHGSPLLPLIMGGGQQQGRRSGTEDPLLVELLALASQIGIARQSEGYRHARSLRRLLLSLLSELEPTEHGQGEEGLPHILSLALPSARGETMATALSHAGFQISTGSACHAGSRGSHVLSAMGLRGPAMDNTMRISFDVMNTEAEVRALAEAIATAYAQVRYR